MFDLRMMFLVFVGGLCSVSAQEPVRPEISYSEDVHPILAERCYKCHGPDENRGGLRMISRESLLEGSEFGPVLTVGDSSTSRIIEVLSSTDKEEWMPKKGDRLTAEQIAILKAWIDQGLVWDASETGEQRWEAPLAPQRPRVPKGRGIHGSRHPIDRFVHAYFKEHGLAPPPVAGDRVFARRVFLDTVGLLPTERQLEDFLSAKNRGKRNDLLDLLLASDRDYAEHWMTFWNDALRNDFEGTGYIDGGRKQITRWLYNALYENKPFDAFARELIHPGEASRGFTDGIVWRGVTVAAQRPALQASRSVAQVFLGVNLKCTSCHDSFIDDWKLTDAYGLAAVFADEPLELIRCGKPTGRLSEVKFLWPELGAIDGSGDRGSRTEQLAALVTKEENGRFARTLVNRIWAEVMGRGLVEPLENMGKEPWHPDLLDWLAVEFTGGGHDVRALLRLIMTSKAYQLVSASPAPDDEHGYIFRGPEARPLSAEQFLDAVSRVSGVWQHDEKIHLPRVHGNMTGGQVRAWRITADPLTRALGRPNREQVVLRRPRAYTTLQALELSNGESLAGILDRAASAMLEEDAGRQGDFVERLYARALQRPPTESERRIASELMAGDSERGALEDLLWAVVMLPEFRQIH